MVASLEDEVEVDLLDDKTVQEVLAKQVDLRKYAAEVESGLRVLAPAPATPRCSRTGSCSACSHRC